MNNFVRTFYRVTIDDAGFLTTPPADGFIDQEEVWENSAYVYRGTPGTAVPTNIAAGKLKARSFWRWEQLKRFMSEAPLNYFGSVDDTGVTSPTIDAAPGDMAFTVGYDKAPDQIQTIDENDGTTVITGADAVKRMAARVFVYDFNSALEYYDPTESDGIDNGVVITSEDIDKVAAGGSLAARITDAETNITVVVVANVE